MALTPKEAEGIVFNLGKRVQRGWNEYIAAAANLQVSVAQARAIYDASAKGDAEREAVATAQALPPGTLAQLLALITALIPTITEMCPAAPVTVP